MEVKQRPGDKIVQNLVSIINRDGLHLSLF